MALKPTCKELAERIGIKLIKCGLTLSTAESCTGGMIGASITSIPGASQWFRGGIIAYDNSVKMSLLNVPRSILDSNGAVSTQTAKAMAFGACLKLETECAIAVTGIAGPDGGTEEKPVGLVYIGVCYLETVEIFKHIFSGNRDDVREQTVHMGIRHLAELLKISN